jgi:predicted dehydrogenase
VRVRAAPAAQSHVPNWRRDPAIAGGGIVMDHGWHAIYLALHWFRAMPTGVAATVHRHDGGAVEDEAVITLEFPDGEAAIALTWAGSERRNTIRLLGEAGRIVIADDVLHVTGVGGSSTAFASALSAGSHHPEWFDAMLPEAFACFKNPARAAPLFDEAVECLSIIGKIYGAGAAPLAPAP